MTQRSPHSSLVGALAADKAGWILLEKGWALALRERVASDQAAAFATSAHNTSKKDATVSPSLLAALGAVVNVTYQGGVYTATYVFDVDPAWISPQPITYRWARKQNPSCQWHAMLVPRPMRPCLLC